MNVLTFVIAAAAWAQFSATKGQLETMNRQLDEMRTSGKDGSNQAAWIIGNMNWLAKEMHYSVWQAQSSIESSRSENERTLKANIDTMRIDQRAWLSVGTIPNTTVIFEPQKLLTANLAVINTGKTPARDVWIRCRSTAAPKGQPPDFAAKLRGTEGSRQFFGPGFSAPLIFDVNKATVGEATYKAVAIDRTSDLFVYGRADYIDAFGFKHWIAFSYLYDAKTCDLKPYSSDADKELR
jgi:hypothetical protein